jgi:hypothetical protein
MFAQPGFWLMIAGALMVAFGFIGLAFSRMGSNVPANRNQPASIPVEPPNPLPRDRTLDYLMGPPKVRRQ